MRNIIFLLSVLLFLSSGVAVSKPHQPTWPEWVHQIRVEALHQGIRPALFDQVFSNIKRPSARVLRYDRTQPEKRLTFLKYRNTRADSYRILIGRRQIKKHRALLNQIARE